MEYVPVTQIRCRIQNYISEDIINYTAAKYLPEIVSRKYTQTRTSVTKTTFEALLLVATVFKLFSMLSSNFLNLLLVLHTTLLSSFIRTNC